MDRDPEFLIAAREAECGIPVVLIFKGSSIRNQVTEAD